MENTSALPAGTESVSSDISRRVDFYRITDEDAARMREFRAVAEQHTAALIGKFYEHLQAHGETHAHLQSEKHVRRLQQVQSEYFLQLFDGTYDGDYAENRFRVGRTHERIGLGPQWYIGAYAQYLTMMCDLAHTQFAGDAARANATLQSIIKVICLDMGIAIDTYIEAMVKREAEQVGMFVGTLSDFSGKLDESSAGILKMASAQTAAAQQQATAVTEVTATLSELRQTSTQALEQAEAVIAGSERAAETSRVGSGAVEAAVAGMRDIREQVEAIAEKILTLSEQTQQIGEIIASVNEIAEQSKLLALNAAIEAARAGDHGRGFAVVATEIRSLADQSKHATGQVRKILSEIQAATNAAVVATEEGNKKVEAGMQLADRAGHTIRDLMQGSEDHAGAARLIANAARQQSAGIQQVADAMVSLNEAAGNTAQSLRNAEQGASDLERMVGQMNAIVKNFTDRKEHTVEYRLA